jgi:CheY-like chemotaxis protein
MRILIVEDQALVAMEIEEMLALAGHEAVAQADDFRSAVSAAKELKPDLALVDIQLAGGDSGLALAAALKSRGVPVLFATGNCATDQARDLALGCLHKPITDSSLRGAIKAIEALLAGRDPPPLPSAMHLYI